VRASSDPRWSGPFDELRVREGAVGCASSDPRWSGPFDELRDREGAVQCVRSGPGWSGPYDELRVREGAVQCVRSDPGWSRPSDRLWECGDVPARLEFPVAEPVEAGRGSLGSAPFDELRERLVMRLRLSRFPASVEATGRRTPCA
jgi:hypothetical protein